MADNTNLVRKKKCKKPKLPESSVWEIAYGDFMTSMMAFFLVMWLVAATNEQQRKIIEYYFTHPMQSVSVSQGSGLNPSKGVFDIGSKQLVISQMPSENKPITINNQASQLKRHENKYEMQNQMASILGKIQEAVKSNKEIAPYGAQIKFSINEEGLNIILFDKNDRPMFANGSIEPEPYTLEILKIIASNIRPLPNKLVIEGYANYTPTVSGPSNWDLSVGRANSARRVLESQGIVSQRFSSVVGYGDTRPMPGTLPQDPVNRRIVILIKKL
ncbi:flagellar motor protein MotB [Desulfurella sp.]|uniref:flagellar motor protein MotB n=1 Tax=Desulfurella sp. TaxID=1962857 RepID=UPI003D1083E7